MKAAPLFVVMTHQVCPVKTVRQTALDRAALVALVWIVLLIAMLL